MSFAVVVVIVAAAIVIVILADGVGVSIVVIAVEAVVGVVVTGESSGRWVGFHRVESSEVEEMGHASEVEGKQEDDKIKRLLTRPSIQSASLS